MGTPIKCQTDELTSESFWVEQSPPVEAFAPLATVRYLRFGNVSNCTRRLSQSKNSTVTLIVIDEHPLEFRAAPAPVVMIT